MFSFFSEKKRIASHIGITVSNDIRVCFSTTEYIDQAGNFHPPYAFWADEYIIGYVYILFGLFLRSEFNSSSFSMKKKGEIILLSLIHVCGQDWRQVWNVTKKNPDEKSTPYANCADDAVTIYGIMTGRLKVDLDNPLLEQAKLLAERNHKSYIEASALNNTNLSNNSALGMAYKELTLMRHIRNRYLNA